MIPMKKQSSLRLLIWTLTGLVLCGGFFAFGYWQGRRALAPQLKTLTDEVAVLQHPAQNAAPPASFIPPNIPADASPEMREYLLNQAKLSQKMADLRQRSPNPNGPVDPKLLAQFQADNAVILQRQKDLAQIINRQQVQKPIPEPPPLQIPPDASPKLKLYLTHRDQLMRDQVAIMNQHRTDDPSIQQAAMQQWRERNADRFQQLQQESQALAKDNSAATVPIAK